MVSSVMKKHNNYHNGIDLTKIRLPHSLMQNGCLE